MSNHHNALRLLGVKPSIIAHAEVNQRIRILAELLVRREKRAYVLCIAGGLESIVAGALARRAVDRVRKEGGEAQLVALVSTGHHLGDSLVDECLELISPDHIVRVDTDTATTNLALQLAEQIDLRGRHAEERASTDLRSRQVGMALHSVAEIFDGLVLGTTNASQVLARSFVSTSGNIHAADVSAFGCLTMTQIHEIGHELGLPIKRPADFDYSSLKTALGNTPLKVIEEFLIGNALPPDAIEHIALAYNTSRNLRTHAYDV
jgi:NAD+ synthase